MFESTLQEGIRGWVRRDSSSLALHPSSHIALQRVMVPTLELLSTGTHAIRHGGEISSCCYSPDGQFVLSGGWDGHLRLWDAGSGAPVTS